MQVIRIKKVNNYLEPKNNYKINQIRRLFYINSANLLIRNKNLSINITNIYIHLIIKVSIIQRNKVEKNSYLFIR